MGGHMIFNLVNHTGQPYGQMALMGQWTQNHELLSCLLAMKVPCISLESSYLDFHNCQEVVFGDNSGTIFLISL